ncbi:MAG: methylated-DNA--[protein]-cysteine S-methyltransferase [Planctomycetaceae bacterium]
MLQYFVFPTDLGFWGIAGNGTKVHAVIIGHLDRESAEQALIERLSKQGETGAISTDWYPQLRKDLERFSGGETVDFRKVELHLPEKLTPFQRKVLALARKLAYGKTVSYQELASRAGHPGAARAVGSVMANNPLPILIPCHRVLGANKKLGGFSAPSGTELKKELLNHEDPTLLVLS